MESSPMTNSSGLRMRLLGEMIGFIGRCRFCARSDARRNFPRLFQRARTYGERTRIPERTGNRMSDERSPMRGFDESTYLTMNPDVGKAVQDGSVPSGLWHFITTGFRENRVGVPLELARTIKRMEADATASLPPAALRKRVAGVEDPSSFTAI